MRVCDGGVRCLSMVHRLNNEVTAIVADTAPKPVLLASEGGDHRSYPLRSKEISGMRVPRKHIIYTAGQSPSEQLSVVANHSITWPNNIITWCIACTEPLPYSQPSAMGFKNVNSWTSCCVEHPSTKSLFCSCSFCHSIFKESIFGDIWRIPSEERTFFDISVREGVTYKPEQSCVRRSFVCSYFLYVLAK